MSNRTYKNLLNLNEASFRKIVSGLIKSNKKNAEIELIRKHVNIDKTLFSAIDTVLDSLRRDEGEVGIFLYRYFNLNLSKNKKFKQLDIFIFELNRAISRLKKDKGRVSLSINQLDFSISELNKFKDAFVLQLKDEKERKHINKLTNYLNKVENFLDDLINDKKLLEERLKLLNSIEEEYKLVKDSALKCRRIIWK
jgi:hypothetical protein